MAAANDQGVSRSGRWAGYAACACAFLFAAVSFYWGVGGTAGLNTVGQGAVELSASGNVAVFVALWFVGLLKVAGGLLALALVQAWGVLLGITTFCSATPAGRGSKSERGAQAPPFRSAWIAWSGTISTTV